MIRTTSHEHIRRPGRVVMILAAFSLAMLWVLASHGAARAATPTCSDVLDISVHGQHVVGDYVTGTGHGDLAWPPAGKVGQAIAGTGADMPGGPGPGFHFPNGFAPGASFCNSQSQSPGFHVPSP
jgi:hypothetical protein